MTETVVILGAGAGFGLAIARAFGQQGQHPVLVARNENRLQQMSDDLRNDGITADWLAADAGDANQTNAMFNQIMQRWGIPQTFVYNVADTSLDDPLTTPTERIARSFDLNVLGAIRTARQFIALAPRDSSRNILITGGGAALNPTKDTTTLSLTKAALRSYTQSLAAELAGTGIYVGLITIQGISDTSEAMAPKNVAQTYVQAAAERQHSEIRYPAGEQSTSEFDDLKALVNEPTKLQAFLKDHPGAADFLRKHPNFLQK
ncbi:SDR family NAD(P)-dependent oxidoreductase [Levilactobacillus yonginensis]|uniref:SDR family NAD(P)-dependent oxidoreductase n=1 Tax=Levilactobacillus yonginensis TaxID=1054041 RepID=UPI00345D223D